MGGGEWESSHKKWGAVKIVIIWKCMFVSILPKESIPILKAMLALIKQKFRPEIDFLTRINVPSSINYPICMFKR